MLKKEAISKSRKAQITIFMILGLIILFIGLFVIQIGSKTQKTALAGEQEEVFNQIFKKETLKIYVDACFNEGLENGIELLGKHGRIWDDQWGTRNFQDGNTGIIDSLGNRVYYGITKEGYPQDLENAYPCIETENGPEFCKFSSSNPSDSGFGRLELRNLEQIEEDLRNYLFGSTKACINAKFQEFSERAEVNFEESSLELKILDEGIAVKANYPMKFNFEDQEYFHLNNFDVFYPTNFGPFLKVGVLFPLQNDQRNLNFAFDQDALIQPSTYSWAEQYNSLRIVTTYNKLDNGDTIFTIKPGQSPIRDVLFYEFHIARQNRPPALDYISRKGCTADDTNPDVDPEYDYLVIKDSITPVDDSLYGEIKFTALAKDPDDDTEESQITYSSQWVQCPEYLVFEINEGGEFYIPPEQITDLFSSPIFCTIKVKATEILPTGESGLSDEQDVRILIDRPLTTKINLNLTYYFERDNSLKPYYDYDPTTLEQLGLFPYSEQNDYVVSSEDPILLQVTHPPTSNYDFSQDIYLTYNNDQNTEQFILGFPDDRLVPPEGRGCFSFPGLLSPDCTLDTYNDETIFDANLIEKWNNFISIPYNPEDLNSLDIYHFKEANSEGTLSLTAQVTYCKGDGLQQESQVEARVYVKSCMPHQNPEHPWPYPYHYYTYDILPDGSISYNEPATNGNEETFNPFEATHACCISSDNPGDWGFEDENKICFENPEPGCYGHIDGFTTSDNEGYLLEKQIRTCSGPESPDARGNICGGSFKNELFEEELRCGTPGLNSECDDDKIDTDCYGQLAYSYVEEKQGWCVGKMGCEFSDDSVSYDRNRLPGVNNREELSQYIHQRAKEIPATNSDQIEWFKDDCSIDGWECI